MIGKSPPPSKSSNSPTTFEPNLEDYSLEQILDLFQTDVDSLTPFTIKAMKRKVLMLHPDKSKLGPEYFIFYKRALSKIVDLYNEIHKQDRQFTPENTTYSVESNNESGACVAINNETKQKGFNKKFNALFESKMMTPKIKKNNSSDWFHDVAKSSSSSSSIHGIAQINDAMEEFKTKQDSLIKYNGGFRTLNSSHSAAGHKFDSDDDDDDNESIRNHIYIGNESGNCRGIQFDDLRRVHRDQTVIPVSATNDLPPPKTIDMMKNERGQVNGGGGGGDGCGADSLLHWEMEQETSKQRLLEKRYKGQQQTDKYEAKNQTILSYFLRLT